MARFASPPWMMQKIFRRLYSKCLHGLPICSFFSLFPPGPPPPALQSPLPCEPNANQGGGGLGTTEGEQSIQKEEEEKKTNFCSENGRSRRRGDAPRRSRCRRRRRWGRFSCKYAQGRTNKQGRRRRREERNNVAICECNSSSLPFLRLRKHASAFVLAADVRVQQQQPANRE